MQNARPPRRTRKTIPGTRFVALIAIATAVLTACTDAPAPPTKPTADASAPTSSDPRFAGKPPALAALKELCRSSITTTAISASDQRVRVSWTWPSKHVPHNVRCYTENTSSVNASRRAAQHGAKVTMWVEFSPHEDVKRLATAGSRSSPSCDPFSDEFPASPELQSVAGVEVCTSGGRAAANLPQYEKRSAYIDRAVIVSIGTVGYIPTKDQEKQPGYGDMVSFTNSVHKELLTAVVKGFAKAD